MSSNISIFQYSNDDPFKVDICPEELHNSIKIEVPVHSDILTFCAKLVDQIGSYQIDLDADWWLLLKQTCELKRTAISKAALSTEIPLNYYSVFHHVQEIIPKDTFVVSDGWNTMKIGATMLHNNLPRHRLDAGTWGAMGVGPGYAIAAALYCRDNHSEKRVICVEGDSAFGFSGMEVETMFRYRLPIVIIIVNNGGIYSGLDAATYKDIRSEGDLTKMYVRIAL